MADTFRGIITADGKKRQLPYRNVLETPISDETLSIQGGFADSKTVGDKFAKVDSETASLKEDLTKDHERLFNESENLIDNDNMVSGFYTVSTDMPTIVDNSGLKCILVEIDGNTEYTISSMSYSSSFYDKGKNKISSLPKSNDAVTFTSPVNAKYISVSAYTPYLTGLMMVKGDTLPSEFIPYKNESAMDIANKALNLLIKVQNTEYEVGANKEYKNFTELIKTLDGYENQKKIYIYPGVYNIFDEYGGADFAQSIADTNWRDWSAVVPPNTTIIGLGRVIFNFLPDGADCTMNSVSVLSPLNTSGNCEIDNITINCKNCRYGIHDETSGITDFYYAKKKFKNVRVNRFSNDDVFSSPYGHAYASGFDVGVDVTFDGCYFSSPSLAWSVHDRPQTIGNNGGIFTLKDSYFNGISYAGLQFLNNNTDPSETIVKIINCYVSKLRNEKVSKTSKQKNGFNITSYGCKEIPVVSDFDDDDYPYTAYNVIN